MLRNYRYRWDRKYNYLTKFELDRNGTLYKKILINNKCYTIVKFTTKHEDKPKTNRLIFKVRIWIRGCYNTLGLFNNPRQAVNFIKGHSRDEMFLFA